MVVYKENDYLAHMSDIQKFGKNFSGLNEHWDNIKLLCEINCPSQSKNILPSMAAIQKGFFSLQQELISTLITETLNKLEQKTISKAQAAVDILVRNLYERTADVGFLATDDEIRSFMCVQERTEEQCARIKSRLRAYVAKYSVYEEIIILDRDFNVLVNLDDANPIAGMQLTDPLLNDTVDSSESFVETFRPSSLQPGKKNVHIFSSKIYNEDSTEVLGVLCLCFRFENEMKQIFHKLDIDYDGSVIMILDEKDTVLASSDWNHVPQGVVLEPVVEEKNGVVYYRGREYIAKTVKTKGYQGYLGLGWKGHILVPVSLAFKEKASKILKSIPADILQELMSRADSFSASLQEIVQKTEEINRSLRRIVYNGQIIAKNEVLTEEEMRLRPILSSINKIGTDTGLLFEQSIKNLFATVISASLLDVTFLASLCIDIMDRNLYERADDCRWWALNSTFQTILAKKDITEKDTDRLTAILSYINSLYTVYTNLFLFDKTGKIIAVSNPARSRDIGKVLDMEYTRNILSNRSEERYYVSPFEETDLYDNRYTYIYGASVADESGSATVGGIGIVFDSAFQFKAMLEDCIPLKEGSFAVFTDRSGKIVASTDAHLKTGEHLKLPKHLFKVENGMSHAEILLYQKSYYTVGCVCSSGYREYKHSDDYQNDVLAFVFEKLADSEAAGMHAVKNTFIEQTDVLFNDKKKHIKVATFLIGDSLFGLDQSIVTEVIDTGKLIELPDNRGVVKGAVVYNSDCIPVVDTHMLFKQDRVRSDCPHLLLARLPEGMIALEADELNNVLEINESDIKPVSGLNNSISVIKGIVSFENAGKGVLIVLNHEALFNRLDKKLFKMDMDEVMPYMQKEVVSEDNK